jgi:hypothetical protein
MASLTGTYDPSQVIVSVSGVSLRGFSDGDAIAAKRDEDMSSKKVGIDGKVGRARNANKSGTFEFKLLQTSGANAELSALIAADNLLADGLGTFPISIIDGSGASLAYASQCWVKTMPEATFGKEVGERTWVFDAADLTIVHGGN